MRQLLRSLSLGGFLLLVACGTGPGAGSLLAPLADQTTLVDEPLVVPLGIAGVDLEAQAYDPDDILQVGPVLEEANGQLALRLIPRSLVTGEAQITVKERNGSAGESFLFRVVPPYRSVAQEFDLTWDPEADQLFSTVDLDGDTLAIGTPYSASEGVDDSGAVYVYRFGAGGWELEQKLFAADLPEEHSFGAAVDVSGDLLIVGATRDHDVASNAGAAYIFERQADGWKQITKLLPPAAAGTYQGFGRAVAIAGDLAVVGAPRADSDGLTDNGQVHVYRRLNSISWVPQAILHPSDAMSEDQFGDGVATDGTTVAAVVPGVFGLSHGRALGVAYLFEPVAGTWQQIARLTPIEPQAESFGATVRIEGDTVVVGAPHRSIVDRDGEFPGAIYVFERSGEEFDKVTKLVTGSEGADSLGARLALAGDYILASIVEDEEPYLHLYKRHQGRWALVNAMAAADLGASEVGSIDLSADHAVVAATLGDGRAFLHLPR